ncbi:MAG TPA: molybdopterin molybdenumtransferase MoeA, partial [Rhodocyclaceae bacterium]
MDSRESLSVAQAQALVLSRVAPVSGSERIDLQAALGRIVAADVLSPIDVPAHDNSAMDGYALRSADLGEGETRLRIAGSAFAGRPHDKPVGPGECIRIMTGAVLP